MTNTQWHKPTNSFPAAAMRKQQLIMSLVQQRFLSSDNGVQRLRKFNMVSKSYQCYYWLHSNTNLQNCRGKFSLNTPLIFFKIRLSHKPYSHRKPNIQNDPLPFSAQPYAAFQYDSTWYSHPVISYHQAPPLPGSLTTSIPSDSWSISSSMWKKLIFWVLLRAHHTEKKRWQCSSWKLGSAI